MTNNTLQHHGILGQKWGVRRYQNPDGSFTSAGRRRYGIRDGDGIDSIVNRKGAQRRLNDIDKATSRIHRQERAINKKLSKTKSVKKAERYKQQASRLSMLEKQGQKEINNLITKMEGMGYDVNSKNVKRLISSGKDFVVSEVASTIISAPFYMIHPAVGLGVDTLSDILISTKIENGTKYKVKK